MEKKYPYDVEKYVNKNKHYKHVEKKRKKMIKKREEKNIEFIHKS